MKIAVLIFLFSTICWGQKNTSTLIEQPLIETKSVLFGHNLTPTTHTLKKGVWTVGNIVLGNGITDRLTIATSPWLFSSYNMYNGFLRSRSAMANGELGFQLGYFKTGNFGKNQYQMEAVSLSSSYGYNVTPNYTFTLSVNYMYFFEETFPFSLRREPFNDQPYQFSLTTLHEANLSEKVGFIGELGVLGLNYSYPQLHFGTSMNYKAKSWLVQLGFSQTVTMSKAQKSLSQASYHNSQDPTLDYAIHPEFQAQYFF